SRFATDQEPVKSRRESERRPTQEMTGDLKRAGRLCNKAQQLSSFESEQEHGKGRVWIFAPRAQGGSTCRCPQHIQPRKGRDFLEEDASFHRPAPVMSEDED
ncbi:hypothetical protein CAPTEDRAFT_203961, partial [Capitella teleta]